MFVIELRIDFVTLFGHKKAAKMQHLRFTRWADILRIVVRFSKRLPPPLRSGVLPLNADSELAT